MDCLVLTKNLVDYLFLTKYPIDTSTLVVVALYTSKRNNSLEIQPFLVGLRKKKVPNRLFGPYKVPSRLFGPYLVWRCSLAVPHSAMGWRCWSGRWWCSCRSFRRTRTSLRRSRSPGWSQRPHPSSIWYNSLVLALKMFRKCSCLWLV